MSCTAFTSSGLKGQYDLRLVCRARRTHQPLREDVVLNGEVLAPRVNLRKISDGVDRLEAEAKATDGGLVLVLGDVADTSERRPRRTACRNERASGCWAPR